MINDLIGLSYERRARFCDNNGETDCFMLVCEVRRRLNLHDYEDEFRWAYDDYEAGTLPIKRIIRWLLIHGEKTSKMENGNIAIMFPPKGEIAVGVVYDGGIVTVSKGGRSFWTQNAPKLKLFKIKADESK